MTATRPVRTLSQVSDCQSCGTENPEHARFCLGCGTVLVAAGPRRGEERKVVSVLFADLVGFTAASDRADPEEVLATLRPYHALLRTEIERYGGTVEKFIGDAVMAVFGAPIAHEDDAERAVRAGLRITEALAELNADRPGTELAVRVAVNTGEAIVSLDARPDHGEGMVAGDVVNTASRLQQVAPVGAVVVGEATQRATSQMIDYEPMDAVEVKGKVEPIPIWRVTGARSRYIVEVDRPTSPFIGRASELEMLKQAYLRMVREESVQLVTVTGEPGVGKSRLIGEFFNFADAEPELFFWRSGRCLPYGDGVTFWALGEVIKAQAGILETDAAEVADAKLRGAVELVVEDAKDRDWIQDNLASLVGSRPGSTTSSDRTEAFSAWRAYLEAMAAFRPFILVIEDLHWADDAMLEFVEYLADWASGVPLLVLCTARPELYERRPGWGGGKRNSTTVGLSPLHPEEIGALVSGMLEETLLPAETQAALLERAGGNPLYAEEFVRMLTDRGILRRSGHAWHIVSDGEIPVPETVQALIAARMDTLSTERKSLIHDAAVVGRIFWPGALAMMGGSEPGDVVQGLHDLLRKELVRPVRRSSMEGQDEFTFWHILVRDVAYAQIPRAQRAARHLRAAQWIERAAGERVEDHADILAHHYVQAIEMGGVEEAGVREAARRYLYLAGERASRLDLARAEALYRRALELTLPEDALYPQLRFRLGQNAFQVGRTLEAVTEVRAARDVFLERNEPVRAAGAMTFLAIGLRFRNEIAESRVVLDEALRILEAAPPGPELAEAYQVRAGDAMLSSHHDDAVSFAQKAIDIAEAVGLEELKVRPLQMRGWGRFGQRDVDGARDDLRTAVELGQERGHPGDTSIAFVNYGGYLWTMDGPEAGLRTYEEGQTFARRRGQNANVTWSRGESTWCMYELGRWDDLIAAADEVDVAARAGDWPQPPLLARPQRVKVLLYRGHLDEAATLSAETVPAARSVGDPQLLIPALEAAALVAAAQDLIDEVGAHLREIREVTQAGNFVVQANSTELIRLACRIGDLELAHLLLDDQPEIPGHILNGALTGQAEIAEAEGRLEEAVGAYARAGDAWEAFGNVIEHGRALLGVGRCLVKLGRLQEAARPLRMAREIFAKPGAVVLVGEVDDLLADADATARAG